MIQNKIRRFFSHVRVLKSDTNDIFFNLATEEYLFEKCKWIFLLIRKFINSYSVPMEK